MSNASFNMGGGGGGQGLLADLHKLQLVLAVLPLHVEVSPELSFAEGLVACSLQLMNPNIKTRLQSGFLHHLLEWPPGRSQLHLNWGVNCFCRLQLCHLHCFCWFAERLNMPACFCSCSVLQASCNLRSKTSGLSKDCYLHSWASSQAQFLPLFINPPILS